MENGSINRKINRKCKEDPKKRQAHKEPVFLDSDLMTGNFIAEV